MLLNYTLTYLMLCVSELQVSELKKKVQQIKLIKVLINGFGGGLIEIKPSNGVQLSVKYAYIYVCFNILNVY